MKFITKLAALGMAAGTAALVLASTPALASRSAVTETAYGAISGKAAAANNAPDQGQALSPASGESLAASVATGGIRSGV